MKLRAPGLNHVLYWHRAWCRGCGAEIAYDAGCAVQTSRMMWVVRSYAMYGTNIAYLRPCYVMSGTDIAYCATRAQRVHFVLYYHPGRTPLSSYAFATPCPVLTVALLYPVATPCAVLMSRLLLPRGWYLTTTDLGYAATSLPSDVRS
eukprot:3206007-Rhodomonas_salina.2